MVGAGEIYMSLLKRLEHERRQEQDRKAVYYREVIMPRMLDIYNYLDELVKTIEYLERDIRANYRIESICEFEDLQQGNYRLSVDSTLAMKRIVLSFECKSDQVTEFTVQGDRLIEQQVSALLSNKLDFSQKFKHNTEGRRKETQFIIKHFVPVAVIIEADDQSGMITIRVHNLPGLGMTRQSVKPEEFDNSFIDRLGRFVLRMDEQFLRQEIPADKLKMIRRNLIREEKKRARELGVKMNPELIDDDSVLQRIRGRIGRILGGENQL
jgi:hypothetical protein